MSGERAPSGPAPCSASPAFQWAVAVAAPIVVALLLIPGRNHLDSADDALVLVVVTVAIASSGSRIRAFVAALVAAASFDFLLTRPYGSFRISRSADITTEVLFVVVGLLVGELAARGRRDRLAAASGRHEIARLHDLSQRIAGGEDPDFILIAVAGELRELLSLQDCRFVRRAAVGQGRLDRGGRHGSPQPVAVARGDGRVADAARRAGRARRGPGRRDLHSDPDPGDADQSRAVRRGGGAGRPARRHHGDAGHRRLNPPAQRRDRSGDVLAQEVGVPGDPVGTQHAPEGADHGAGAGPLQRARRHSAPAPR